MKIAVTGHRPNKLWGYDYNDPHYIKLLAKLREIVISSINCNKEEPLEIISGMALGVDTLFAVLALELKSEGYNVKLVCAIPFKGQESKWIKESQKLYNDILDKADEVVCVCGEGYSAYKMQKRNEYMVNRCDFLIAVWDKSEGGTANCVRYANRKIKDVVYINPKEVSNER